MTTTEKKYVMAWETGMATTERAVAKRLGDMLTAMSHVNDHLVRMGELTEEVNDLRMKVIGKLRDEGWRVTPKGGYGYKVLPPLRGKPTRSTKPMPDRPAPRGDKPVKGGV